MWVFCQFTSLNLGVKASCLWLWVSCCWLVFLSLVRWLCLADQLLPLVWYSCCLTTERLDWSNSFNLNNQYHHQNNIWWKNSNPWIPNIINVIIMCFLKNYLNLYSKLTYDGCTVTSPGKTILYISLKFSLIIFCRFKQSFHHILRRLWKIKAPTGQFSLIFY